MAHNSLGREPDSGPTISSQLSRSGGGSTGSIQCDCRIPTTEENIRHFVNMLGSLEYNFGEK
jgi:hypothetical protein